jgi:hypothetical protein
VVQSGSDALVIDRSDGSLLHVDGATLALSEPVQPFGPGAANLSLFVGGNVAYAVDGQRGAVIPVDPVTLESKAAALSVASKTSETEPPRRVRTLRTLGRLESCQEIRVGGTRLS